MGARACHCWRKSEEEADTSSVNPQLSFAAGLTRARQSSIRADTFAASTVTCAGERYASESITDGGASGDTSQDMITKSGNLFAGGVTNLEKIIAVLPEAASDDKKMTWKVSSITRHDKHLSSSSSSGKIACVAKTNDGHTWNVSFAVVESCDHEPDADMTATQVAEQVDTTAEEAEEHSKVLRKREDKTRYRDRHCILKERRRVRFVDVSLVVEFSDGKSINWLPFVVQGTGYICIQKYEETVKFEKSRTAEIGIASLSYSRPNLPMLEAVTQKCGEHLMGMCGCCFSFSLCLGRCFYFNVFGGMRDQYIALKEAKALSSSSPAEGLEKAKSLELELKGW